ncbi:colicin-like pore-forming protein [Pseudomonas sp. SDO528_S397]
MIKPDFESLKKGLIKKVDDEVSTIGGILRDPKQSFEKNVNIGLDVMEVLYAQKALDLLVFQNKTSMFFLRDPLVDTRLNITGTFTNTVNRTKNLLLTKKEFVDAYRAAHLAEILRNENSYLSLKINVASAELAALPGSRVPDNDQIEIYKRWVGFVTDMNERILVKYGAKVSEVAKGLQVNIVGKKINSYADAMASFQKIQTNPMFKLNSQDARAVASALEAFDKAMFSDNVVRLGKAFGVAGKVVQADNIRQKAILGFETNNWRPLMLELESIALGAGAGAVLAAGIAFAFPTFASATLGIVVISVMMAAVATYIDDSKVEEINNFVVR